VAGHAPDWIAWERGQGFVPDPVTGKVGSYDAIRTYLWAGMLDPAEPLRRSLLQKLSGPLTAWRATGAVPSRVEAGVPSTSHPPGPVGFLAAVLPMVGAKEKPRLAAQIEASRRADGLYGTPPAYYDHALLLFGTGQTSGRFRFARDGRLVPAWSAPPPRSAAAR